MRLSLTPIDPIRKTREVPLDPAAAFDLFTIRMGSWWPLDGHSIAQEHASGVRFEPRVGGRVVELTDDGVEHRWADVIAWDPPYRFALAWHPSIDPDAATVLEVHFTALDSGGTRIELEHRAWEEYGDDDGRRIRENYQSGWDVVLQPFQAASGTVDNG
jgi:uncharacterized protein YndB with AHSA1/START domain